MVVKTTLIEVDEIYKILIYEMDWGGIGIVIRKHQNPIVILPPIVMEDTKYNLPKKIKKLLEPIAPELD